MVGFYFLGSFSINVLGPRIAKGDFAPGFIVDHFIKDLVRFKSGSSCGMRLS